MNAQGGFDGLRQASRHEVRAAASLVMRMQDTHDRPRNPEQPEPYLQFGPLAPPGYLLGLSNEHLRVGIGGSSFFHVLLRCLWIWLLILGRSKAVGKR